MRMLRKTILCALFFSVIVWNSASASVPPEVPGQRTSRIFSPFYFTFGDMGESIFDVGGALNQQGYFLARKFVDGAAPTITNPTGGLDNFMQILAAPTGVLLMASHGGTENIMVEAYPDTDEGRLAALAAIQAYITDGTVNSDEIGLYRVSEGVQYWGISVKPIHFTRRMDTIHSIVYAASCYSYNLWPAFTDRQYVRDYISFEGEVYPHLGDGLDVAKALFENMAGVRNDLGSYSNQTLQSLLPTAQAAIDRWWFPSPQIRISKDAALPEAGDIRLYNAPRIVMADLREDSDSDGTYENHPYQFVFGNDQYPYNPGNSSDYPSAGTVTKSAYKNGPIEIVLRFSEPMRILYPDFHVNLIPPGGGTPIPFTEYGGQGGWSNQNLPDPNAFDTWTGHLSLPSDIPDGEARINVRASHQIVLPGLDLQNQELDLDGDGSSATGDEDSSIRFVIQRFAGTIAVKDGSGNAILNGDYTRAATLNLYGSSLTARLALSGAMDFEQLFSTGDFIHATVSNPPQGAYVASSFAEGGTLLGSSTFTIDRTQPAITLADVDGNPISGSTPLTSVVVHASDSGGSGIASIVMEGPGGTSTHTVAGAPGTADATFTDLQNGVHVARAYDKAGNVSSEESFARYSLPGNGGSQTRPSLVSVTRTPISDPDMWFGQMVSLPDGTKYFSQFDYDTVRFWKLSPAGQLVGSGIVSDPDVSFGFPEKAGFSGDNAYVVGEGYDAGTYFTRLFKVPISGPATFVDFPGEYSVVAADAARGRVYVAATVRYYPPGGDPYKEVQISSFDGDLTLLSRNTAHIASDDYDLIPNDMAVDGNGNFWAAAMNMKNWGSADVLVLGPGGGTSTRIIPIFKYQPPILISGKPQNGFGLMTGTDAGCLQWDSEHGPVQFQPGPDFECGTYYFESTGGGSYVFTSTGVGKLDAEGNLAWNPPYLPTDDWIIASPGEGQLDIADREYDAQWNPTALVVSHYGPPGPMLTIASSDGKAAVESPLQNTTISTAAPETSAPALAAASAQGLSAASDIYELGPSPVTLDREAGLSVSFNPAGVNLASVALYRYDPDTEAWDPARVTEQALADNPDGTKRISGVLNTFSLYGVFYRPVDASLEQDVLAPRTRLVAASSVTISGQVFVGTQTLLGFEVADDSRTVGDLAGVGVAYSSYSVDNGGFVGYASSFTLTAGTHTIRYFSTDLIRNVEAIHESSVTADGQGPDAVTDLAVAAVYESSVTLSWTEPADAGSGMAGFVLGYATFSIDAANFIAAVTVAAPSPAGPGAAHIAVIERLNLSEPFYAGLYSKDRVGNLSVLSTASYVPASETTTITPSSGPIGIPFVITGTGFGAKKLTSGKVRFGTYEAAVSSWTDGRIAGTVPGVSSGTWSVEVLRQWPSSSTVLARTSFEAALPQLWDVIPDSGPIGVRFTLLGDGFGAWAGSLRNQVLFEGSTVPVTSWKDDVIQGTVPGFLEPGVHPIWVRRTTTDGGLMESTTAQFELIVMSPDAMSPSTGPIGIPITITGSGFGARMGSTTRVWVGVSTATVSSWTDTKIMAKVPGFALGTYEVAIERIQGEYEDRVAVGSFTVTPIIVSSFAPSSGPIGMPITLQGPGFGPRDGNWTQILFAGTTVPITSWLDARVTFDAPGGFGNGAQSIVLRRTTTDGGLMESTPVSFEIINMSPASMNPSTGPIGIPITITGAGFGTWDGVNTRVLINGATVHVNSWIDTKISADIPGLPAGEYPVAVERAQGAYTDTVSVGSFTVTPLAVSSFAPSSGPIGTPITLLGPGFGPYDGVWTQVLFAGTTVPVTSWSDAKVTFDAPGGFGNGPQSIILRRATTDGGLMESAPVFFEVINMSPASMNPSTGPIGIPITITGAGFGVWSGQETRLRIGASTVPVTSWTNTKITAKIPGMGHESYCEGAEACAMQPGIYPVSIQRVQGAADESVFVASFTLTPLAVSSLAPAQAPIGSSFTLTGTGFGPANGAYTQVLINGTSAPLATWTDTKIGAKVPGTLAPGIYPLWIERRTTDGAVQASASMDFTVVVPQISSMTPTGGKAGTSVTLYGSGFGYNAGASYNRVLINGIAAALSSWTDAKIKCIVPDSLAIGTYPVVVERTPAGGAVQSNSLEYSVTAVKSVSMLALAASGAGQTGTTAGSWNQPDWDYEAELSIPAQEGGRVENALRVSVEVPANAVAEDLSLSMRKGRQTGEQVEGKRMAAQAQAGLSAAGPAVEFGPEGTQFDIPATIELPYGLAADQQAGTLALYWWDPEAGKWTQVSSELDQGKGRLRARVSHFSLYQPMAQSARPSAASEAFALHEIYVFPNPARGGAKPTFHVEVGLADGLSIRIYDVSGRLVHSGGIEGPPGTVNDGQGLEYAYEYVWEGRIASGVYFYAIEARKGGQASIRKSGKLGVVR